MVFKYRTRDGVDINIYLLCLYRIDYNTYNCPYFVKYSSCCDNNNAFNSANISIFDILE